MERHYNRFWCTTCQDFTLQDPMKDGACTICGTVTTSYKLKDVPEEKILEQRERYKQSKKKYYDWLLSKMFMPSNPMLDFMREMTDEDWQVKTVINETDAGQKAIDDRDSEIRNAKREEARLKRVALIEEYQKYKKLGRNDRCACGSGKKYKACCIDRFTYIK